MIKQTWLFFTWFQHSIGLFLPGILHLYEDILLSLEFIQIAQFLTKLPLIECEVLFRSIEVIDIHQKKFSQVLTNHMANNSHNQ